ncbi:MAG TPA: pectinesterase family protein [Blastocatellia bacterium]|nr:pectinesterase family protein [Blastocatellia bacterium]
MLIRPPLVFLVLVCGLHLSLARVGLAQDTRTVTEPTTPPVCLALKASLFASHGSIDGDGSEPDTLRLQQAIDHCKPGSAVALESDRDKNAFLSGPISLRPGVTLLVSANTTLFASRNPRDYDVTPGSCGKIDNNGKGCRPLIKVLNAPNAAVMGDGVIDGRGGAQLLGEKISWWDLAQTAKVENARQNVPRLIAAEASDNFTLYRITLRNSPNYHVIVTRTNGFTAWGVKIDSPKTARNTDGIDPSSSTNVSILHCYIRCGDDNVAIKAGTTGPASHITVAHNHFYSGHGMSIGSETEGEVSGIEVSDLTIDGAVNGLRIKSNSSRGGMVRDVSYRNICIRNVRNPIIFDPFYSTERGGKIPEFQDILLQNVSIGTSGKITLLGVDQAHPLKVFMDRVIAREVRPGDIQASHLQMSMVPASVTFTPRGADVRIAEVAAKTPVEPEPGSCQAAFVPFPAQEQRLQASPGRKPATSSKPLIVAADGRGDYRSVQAAIDVLPQDGGVIRIRPGVYREVVRVAKPHVRLLGSGGPAGVTIVFDKSAGTAGGTLKSATVSVVADDFFARDLTFSNDFSVGRELKPQGSQAVALLVTGDRAIFRNVRLLGAQDTLYAGSQSCASEQGPCTPARQYFSNCYIEGNVDFIFGDAKAFFQHCEIHVIPHRIAMLTAQSKHYPDEQSGFVFNRCKVTADPAAGHIFLGRPWRPYSTVVFINTDLEAHVEPDGWREWHPGETRSLETAFYAEFNSTGPGSNVNKREIHSKQLSSAEARRFSVTAFLSGPDSWRPSNSK